jgi:hypothetical protein
LIRTTREAPMFALWRGTLLAELARVENLTTARYEPVSRNALGSGIVDLLFERRERSCVLAAVRLDPNSLVTRERSPFVWPATVAEDVDSRQLLEFERYLTPWLRSLARGRPMARESIRRFGPSERFERARDAELLGATPLARVMRRMAPFVFARRFATGARVVIDCADDALAQAVLADLPESIRLTGRLVESDPLGDRAFARAWYGTATQETPQGGALDLALVDGAGTVDAPTTIEMSASWDGAAPMVDVPAPAPLDLLFSFDSADAPAVSRFAVSAVELPLRDSPLGHRPAVIGGSAGSIVLALSAEALAMRDADVQEAETLRQCLSDEGLTAVIVSDIDDPAMAVADLVHIFGSVFEEHTIAFAQAAQQRGADFVFDVAPRAQSPSGYAENMLVLALRAASDDAETLRYLEAYQGGRASGTSVPEPSAEQYARVARRFAELAASAVAILAMEEDVEVLRESLPPAPAARVFARGWYAAPEPPAAEIGHLVPHTAFAFTHAVIAARSHALLVALASRSCGVPLVIAGPCYDVEYLQTLRAIAPDAVVLADADSGVVAAIYRRAAIWIDAAPRPRSAAGLVRAVMCGALPVLASESPLARIAGSEISTFGLTSFAECGATLSKAMALSDRGERIRALQDRMAPRGDLARTFQGLLTAYAHAASAVSARAVTVT